MFSDPVLLDHFYVALYAIAYPVIGYIEYQRILKLTAAGNPPPRATLYLSTLIGHWAIMALGVGLWIWLGRPWETIGFSFNLDWWFVLGAVLSVAILALLFYSNVTLKRNTDDQIRAARKRFAPVAPLLPQTRRELSLFYRLSITAGIVEEILWRGALIWYLSHYMPPWAAGIISAVGFGLAHSYQGKAQVPQVIAVGAVFTLLYFLTGSVWVPIIVHALVDILQGKLAFEVFNHPAEDEMPETHAYHNT